MGHRVEIRAWTMIFLFGQTVLIKLPYLVVVVTVILFLIRGLVSSDTQGPKAILTVLACRPTPARFSGLWSTRGNRRKLGRLEGLHLGGMIICNALGNANFQPFNIYCGRAPVCSFSEGTIQYSKRLDHCSALGVCHPRCHPALGSSYSRI